MSKEAARPFTLVPTTIASSLAWMRPDVLVRLAPFTIVTTIVWLAARPAWLGFSPGRLDVQLTFGLAGAAVLFVSSGLLQLLLTPRRGTLGVPSTGADAALQAGFYLLNAPIEEAFFRGLVQGGLSVLVSPVAGILTGTVLYVLYHRLGRWAWQDVAATALVGVPLALAFRLLPGPPSLLGVSLAHFGATCGFIGPGPWLLRRLGALRSRGGHA
jgi:membrane protease YdiL (CAAX protease family)